MGKPKGKRKNKKRRGRIIISQSATLVHKNDATRVARPDTVGQMPIKRVIPDNGATFKVKLRKK